MSKKKEVVYTIPFNTKEIDTQTINSLQQIPSYDDSGTAYKGYYKKKLSGNEYQTMPQERFFLYKQKTGGGEQYYFDDTAKKRLYLTDLHFQWNIVNYDSLNGFYMNGTDSTHASSTANILAGLFYDTKGSFSLHFDVPFMIDFTKISIYNVLRIAISNNVPNANDRIFLQICGFWEI